MHPKRDILCASQGLSIVVVEPPSQVDGDRESAESTIMSSTIFRNKNLVRPRKSGHAKRQRLELHRKRLMALGMPEAKVARLTTKDLRDLLKRPKKVAAEYQTSAE